MEAHHVSSGNGGFEIFLRSVALVGVAELFDKTWFMGLIFALRYSPRLVFVGSFAALFLHCFLAAALGLAFARFLSKVALCYLTAGLFFCFALLYGKDWYYADPESDAIEAGKEEVSGECDLAAEPLADKLAQEDDAETTSTNDSEEADQGAPTAGPGARRASGADDLEKGEPSRGSGGVTSWAVLGKSFMGVFIAEWGDRTQMAMIGQHASQPLVPVFLGSAVAFFLLTLSAVGAASMLNGQKLREKTIFGFSACCFTVFGLLALKDALAASSEVPGYTGQ